MAGLVIDASVAVKWFLTEDRSDQARALASEIGLAAPATILLEIFNALSIAVRKERAVPETLDVAEHRLAGIGWELMPIEPYFQRAARLARMLPHPIFDCIYLAVADERDATLVTADERLFAMARRARIKARLL